MLICLIDKTLYPKYELSYYAPMDTQSWLISWIGETDQQCSEGKRGSDLGPVASAIKSLPTFDRIHLLTNYEYARSSAYCDWLKEQTGDEAELYHIDLNSPIDYADIYEKVCKELKQSQLPRDDVELTFHIRPGTPAMAAIWIILAKTRFPAKLIQTSRELGCQHVDFFFDLANEFLPEFLQRSNERIERLTSAPLEVAPEFDKIIHCSATMREQIVWARKIATYDVPVLILGETGTGKELFAEAIHKASGRASKPFIAVNCGAISRELANSELFGHTKGAFTGAIAARPGHFLEAEGGTLFLDEIGDLPPDSQVRLLRALQQHEITPVGASKPIPINVRIVAATHRDLSKDVAEGYFREDLFHRLAVGILDLPSLRQRGDDLGLLIDHFISYVNADAFGKPESQFKEFSPESRNLLLSYRWPGNVRELYHTILRATIWSSGRVIEVRDVERSLFAIGKRDEGIFDRPLGKGFDLQVLLDDISRHYITRAFAAGSGKKKRAAELLGFSSYQTLSNWAERLGVGVDEEDQ